MVLLCWGTIFFHLYTKRPAPIPKESFFESNRKKFLQTLPSGALIVQHEKITFANEKANALL